MGESGAKRNLMFCLADLRALEELESARASLEASGDVATAVPLEGDIVGCDVD